MTFVEIMMALAVFGIIMLVFVNAVKGHRVITEDNLNQVRMMELARSEMEQIKADPGKLVHGSSNIAVSYPSGSSPAEQNYAVLYEKIIPPPPNNMTGYLCRITVGPAGSVPNPGDPNNYVLVDWLYTPIQFSQATYTINENDPSQRIEIPVNRGGDLNSSVSVDYEVTSRGTAVNPDHYSLANGTLHFAPNDVTKIISVSIMDNLLLDGNKTVNLVLKKTTDGAIPGVRHTAWLTIVDDEIAQPGELQFKQALYETMEGQAVTLTVIRTIGSEGTVTVDYSCNPPGEILTPNGTLTFGSGETEKTITLFVKNNDTYEGTRNVSVTLSNPSGGATLGQLKTANLTLLDDEDVNQTITFNGVGQDWIQSQSQGNQWDVGNRVIRRHAGNNTALYYTKAYSAFGYRVNVQYGDMKKNPHAFKAGLAFSRSYRNSDPLWFYVDRGRNGNAVITYTGNPNPPYDTGQPLSEGSQFALGAVGSNDTITFYYNGVNIGTVNWVTNYENPTYLGVKDDLQGVEAGFIFP